MSAPETKDNHLPYKVAIGTKPTTRVEIFSVNQQAKAINAQLPPVDPLCKAIVVIPVYREYEGGRIAELLHELESQDTGSNRFEVLLVVNNPDSSYIPGLPGLVDNLRFLDFIGEQKKLGSFPNIHVINCTAGELPVRHMGLIRGLGHLTAQDRLDQTLKGGQGVIVQLDADVSVDPGFVSKLLNAYQNPVVHSAMIGRIPLPVDFKSDDCYFTYARQFAQAVATTLDGNSKFLADGPALSFRSFVHKHHLAGNYLSALMSEDFALGRSLQEIGQMFLLAEPRVYKADRVRYDGFDSINRVGYVNMFLQRETAETLFRHIFKDSPGSQTCLSSSIPLTEFLCTVSAKLAIADRNIQIRMQAFLDREESLARRSLDWDHLDPGLKTAGLYLYSLSRLIMDEGQKLLLPMRADREDIEGIHTNTTPIACILTGSSNITSPPYDSLISKITLEFFK